VITDIDYDNFILGKYVY